MADSSIRLRQLAANIRACKSTSLVPGEYSDAVGGWVDEALSLGAFSGPEHAKLRALIGRAKSRYPDHWQDVAYDEAATCLAPGCNAYSWEAFDAIADAIEHEADRLDANKPQKAVWLGKGIVRIDDKSTALEAQETTVLQALIELRGAATRPDLERRAGVKDVAEIMKKLEQRFPKHIFLPGKRGKGGYSTTIEDGTKVEN